MKIDKKRNKNNSISSQKQRFGFYGVIIVKNFSKILYNILSKISFQPLIFYVPNFASNYYVQIMYLISQYFYFDYKV